MIVAVTGPTGDIGRALLRELDADPTVTRVLGMARRRSTRRSMGLEKTEYRQGDVLDRDAVDALAAEADVLVHLAFIILGGREETRAINLEGSRNVFEAASDVKRLVYTSSVAAYGFHPDNPQPLTEDGPGPRHRRALLLGPEGGARGARCRRRWRAAGIETYVLRPCIVAGGDALALVEAFPGLLRKSPVVVLPDPGTRFQLVHTDDVARAIAAAVRGEGEPGRLQPRRRGDDHRRRPRARVRLAERADAADRRRRRRGGGRRAPVHAGPGVVAQRVPRAGRDGHHPRPRAARLGAATTTRAPCSSTPPRSASGAA